MKVIVKMSEGEYEKFRSFCKCKNHVTDGVFEQLEEYRNELKCLCNALRKACVPVVTGSFEYKIVDQITMFKAMQIADEWDLPF